jgi:urease accessory protein
MLIDSKGYGPGLEPGCPPRPQPGWEAHLQLGFKVSHGKTVLSRRHHSGPLVVQRPFYPEGGVCHLYLLHPPGGVVAGDRLQIDIDLTGGGSALVTTPAAGKFYRSNGGLALQSVSIVLGGNSTMEWLPQETICYEGARLKSNMHLRFAAGARFIGWEIYALGRPAAGEDFRTGTADLSWRIERGGVPCYLERQRLDADACASRWGLNGRSSFGTLIAFPASMQTLETVRQSIADQEEMGVTRLDDILICRGLDARADRLRDSFQRIWAALRPELTGLPAHPPRIWTT